MSKVEPRVYISGPIANQLHGNIAAFSFCADVLETIHGWNAINPHSLKVPDHDGPCPPGPTSPDTSSHTGPCHLRVDIEELVQCDAIVMLRGWEHSAGARLEMLIAAQCGMPVWFFNNETCELHSATGSIGTSV